MKCDFIYIEKVASGKPVEIIEKDNCSLNKMDDLKLCSVKECRYGLTDVRVPEDCPIRKGPFSINFATGHRFRFTLGEREVDDV